MGAAIDSFVSGARRLTGILVRNMFALVQTIIGLYFQGGRKNLIYYERDRPLLHSITKLPVTGKSIVRAVYLGR